MGTNRIRINYWLMPLAWLYGACVRFRNFLFDHGVLPSVRFSMPVICVGNITVGGTGKTPHVEYLIRLLAGKYRVAVLSRGYKRKSKGFILADQNTSEDELGDEPFQMKRKFGTAISVAVDADRRHGISTLMSVIKTPPLDVVILDDAFQHRYVSAGMNIALIDYHRLIYNDRLLPAGRLRESVSGIERAHAIVITKCPKDISPEEQLGIGQALRVSKGGKLFFSTLTYGTLQPLYGGKAMTLEEMRESDVKALLMTGIASPEQIEEDLEPYVELTSLRFADHHDFTMSDIKKVSEEFRRLDVNKKIIITTEKDSVRLKEGMFDGETAKAVYVLPVVVGFIGGSESFDKEILNYVRKDLRDSSLSERQSAQKNGDSHNSRVGTGQVGG